MAIVVHLARYWMVVVVLAPFGSSSEIIWSQDPLNGCCGTCNTPSRCKTTPDLENTPIKCSYIQYHQTQINPSTSITKSCGKPDKLKLNLGFGNDTVLNVTWRFPRDETIARVTDFLVVVQYENPSVSGEIVNLFKIKGNMDLDEEELMKLADVEFVYDCVKVLSNTKYTVTVQTQPSIKEAAKETATLVTNDVDEKVTASCNSRWLALMFVRTGNPVLVVCFKSAPELLKINKYVLHVMPRSQYDGPDPRTPENMEKIDLTGQGLSGTIICRNFTLTEPKEYVAVLQPDEFCTCFNEDEVCHHTYINFVVPPASISLSAVTFPSTSSLSFRGSGGSAGGTPTWHVALIAFFISLVVVTGVILLALYCFINGFKDFLRSLLSHFYPTSDTTVLFVFQPTSDSSTNEAIWKLVCHLRWKSRAAIETVPELEKQNGRCSGVGSECIKSKQDEQSIVCQCFCCKMDVESKLKVEILRYDRIIIFHSSESSMNYQVFQKTNDIPVRTCSAFVRVASLYEHKSKPEIKERESLNQLIIGANREQTNVSPEPAVAVMRNQVGSAELRLVSEAISGREESGYFSCLIDDETVAEVEYQVKNAEDEIQVKNSEDEFQIKNSDDEFQIKNSENEFQVKNAEDEFQIKNSENEFQIKNSENEFQVKNTEDEFQVKNSEEDFQEDKLGTPNLSFNGESFKRPCANRISARSSFDQSLSFCGQYLPPVLHVRLSSDEGVDMDMLRSSFNSPKVFDAVKDFYEIVNKITNTPLRLFTSPSVLSEI